MTPVKPPESITILDWYAAHAIAGVVANRTLRDGEETQLARDAFMIATAMFRTRLAHIAASKRAGAVRLRKAADELSAKGYSREAEKRRCYAAQCDADAGAIEAQIENDEITGETT